MKKIISQWLLTLVFIAPILCEDNNMNTFVPPGDELLSNPVEDVPLKDIKSDEIQSIIDLMYKVAAGERTDPAQKSMVGLAAPQIGIKKRIILVDIGVSTQRRELGSLLAFINPVITWYSDEMILDREGCYSVDSRLLGIIPRSLKVRVQAYDREGNFIDQEYSGFTARIFQHEIDHLNGIRFPDRVGDTGILHVVRDEDFLEYIKNFENWNKTCSLSTWQAMKEGLPYELSDEDK